MHRNKNTAEESVVNASRYDFIRIHRSFIVSRSKIKSYSHKDIILCDGQTLPVGRQYSEAVKQMASD